jgi:hypothetical protein
MPAFAHGRSLVALAPVALVILWTAAVARGAEPPPEPAAPLTSASAAVVPASPGPSESAPPVATADGSNAPSLDGVEATAGGSSTNATGAGPSAVAGEASPVPDEAVAAASSPIPRGGSRDVPSQAGQPGNQRANPPVSRDPRSRSPAAKPRPRAVRARGHQVPTSRASARGPRRRASIEAVCGNSPTSSACTRLLAPRSCDPSNPFHRAPFSCRYVLSLNPCHADGRSAACALFLDSPCLGRPFGVACGIFRSGTSLADYCVLVRNVPCYQTHTDFSGCHQVEEHGRPPASAPCRLLAAVFLDVCDQAPVLCGDPYGGTQEMLALTGSHTSSRGGLPLPGGGTAPGRSTTRATTVMGVGRGSVPLLSATAGRRRLATLVVGHHAPASSRRTALAATGSDFALSAAVGLAVLLLGIALRICARATRRPRWARDGS